MATSQPEAPEQVQVLSMPSLTFPECREMRHPWGEPHWSLLRANSDFVERTLACLRCGLQRLDVIARHNGTIAKRVYSHYAEGYRTHGFGRIPNDEVRVELIRRAVRHK